jgi:hypothetical protein
MTFGIAATALILMYLTRRFPWLAAVGCCYASSSLEGCSPLFGVFPIQITFGISGCWQASVSDTGCFSGFWEKRWTI